MGPDLSFRPFTPADWPAVSDIYRQGIQTGIATFETEVPTLEKWLSMYPLGHQWVAVRKTPDGKVVGWTGYAQVSPRKPYAGVAESSIYIAEEGRHQGIGKQLLLHLIAESERQGIWTLQTTILEDNMASIRLHEKCGFRVVGIREKIAQRDGVWRNTFLMERRSSIH